MTAPMGLDELSRRQFFKLAGVGAAAAGIAACSSRPAREILPYAAQPVELTPGKPTYYATALVQDGHATGVLVETHEGRPTKLEGNPHHPASLGATRAIEQAAVMALYDPQRARAITDRGVPASWNAVERILAGARANGGRGVQVVMEPTSSPIVIAQILKLRAILPAARITFWAPFAARTSFAGHRRAFGRAVQAQLALHDADVVVALDADLAGDGPMGLAHARALADRRRVVDGGSKMNRLYAIETSYTPTGILADHRFRVRPSEIGRVAIELLAELVAEGKASIDVAAARASGPRAKWVAAIARDLIAAGSRTAVVAGERQPAEVHAVVAAINRALATRCVGYTEPTVFEAGEPSHDLAPVVESLVRGEVRTLIVLGGNPAYTAPALAGELAGVEQSIYLGLYANETAQACRYVVPGLHDLESWDLVRAADGTLAVQQPMIEPLFEGRSISDVLGALIGEPATPARARVVAAWPQLASVALEPVLARGAVEKSAAPWIDVAIAWPAIAAIVHAPAPVAAAYELEVRPHPFLHDGRHANNPWLQELPEPITKLTWDNAAQVSPRTATQLGVHTGDVVVLAVQGHSLEAPAIVVPGHADGAITLHAGYGRRGEERIARGVGVDVMHLASGSPVEIAVTDRHRALAITQQHWELEGRDELPTGSLAQLAGDPVFRAELARQRGPQPTLLGANPPTGTPSTAQWAMSIDLTTCTGCTACVMACEAENNSPVVGRTQVLNRREMHWLRLDRYTTAEDEIAIEPMTCQHCEKAPCEYVCPVEATTHSPDGLNEMTYNRCVGTRFCSNNCPYKVRRFNWFDFKQHSGLQVLGKNPDVTVRDRGVMEKCTYCVQRIRRAEIDTREAGRELREGDVRTACQQVCPTQAIAFGSLTDERSAVREQRGRPHDYTVLHDQGTVPRTHYLARIRNRNPELG
jgi:molybdopterin-containing oxidoreductase family iron-sulfur binding subunit